MARLGHSTHRSRTPALALLVGLLLFAAPSLASAEPTFTFTGRGWGHGIGMSQYGAKGYAQHGWTYDRILARYYQGTTLGTVPAKTVRVALQKDNVAKPSWRLRANTNTLKVRNRLGKELVLGTDQVFTFTASSGGRIVVKNAASQVVTTCLAPVSVWEHAGVVEVVDASGPQDWTGVCYNGLARLVVSGSNLYLYNDVPMESYVTCVGPREMPASWHTEALKTQAVAARSYAYVSLRATGDYDVYCTTRSQVYNGWGRASGGIVTRHGSDYLYDAPVKATANKVVMYGSTVVQTFFTSTSGGHTENIENVWPGATARPYYKGVKDDYESVAGATYHIWPDKEMAYTASALRSRLLVSGKFTAAEVPASISDVQVTGRGVSGRATRIVLKGAAGDDKVIEGGKIASFKSAMGLRDIWFYVTGFGWDQPAAYAEPGQTARPGFKVTPAVSGTINGFVLRRADGSTSMASGSVTSGKGSVPVASTYAGVRLNSAALLPGTELRGRQGYFFTPELPTYVFSRTERIAGADRYATSVLASKRSFPATAPAVVIVSGSAPADALTGSALAGATNAPVLVTARTTLSATVLAEINRLQPVRAYVLGGAGAVDEAVIDQLEGVTSIGPRVERIGGVDRYDTAARVASRVATLVGGAYDRRALVVSGESFSDAAVVSGFAYRKRVPVLLSTASSLPAATGGALASLGVTRTLVVGGTGAVSDAVLASLPGGVRIASGASRYETAVKLADYLVASEGFAWGSAYVANTNALSDIMVAGPLAGRNRAPLLLVNQGVVPAATYAALDTHSASVTKGYVMGGTGAVSDPCRAAADRALK